MTSMGVIRGDKRVFISHAPEAVALARRLRTAIEDAGVACFLGDDDIPPGANIVEETEAALQQCPILLVLITAGYGESPWALLERSAVMFLDSPTNVRQIVPVISGTDVTVPAALGALAAEHLADEADVPRVVQHLAPRFRSLLQASPLLSFTALQAKYGLRELVVVQEATGEAPYQSLGRGGADYLVEHVQRNHRVGLAEANTVYHVAQQVRPFDTQFNVHPISHSIVPQMTAVLSSYASLITLWERNPHCVPVALQMPTFLGRADLPAPP